jgi:molecular chaperone DnaK (HSP70)
MCSSSKQSTFSTINYNSLSNNKRNKNNNKTIDININSIKIENSSCPSVLCLQNNTNEESISSSFSFQSYSKENNILILNISGDSTNISITSISNEKKNFDNNSFNRNNCMKKYEVKNIENLNFGEEDFINNYLFYNLKSLKDINLDIYNNIIKNPISLSILQNLFKSNISLFDTKPQIEIKVNKLLYNFDLNLIISKQDYINACSDLYNKIISSIKEIISHSKLSEILIDDIILIGQMSKCSHMKNLLCNLFKNNKIIVNKIKESNFENDDFYLVAGTGLEAMNHNLKNNLQKYIFKDICPISYGIENAIGEVDLIIKKGNKIPVVQKNFVKIFKNKNSDFLDIKICEINNENKKVILSHSKINGKNMKLFPLDNKNKDGELVELLFEFEIDINFNLSVFILDKKTFKRRFEFSINIDVIKDK